MCVCVCMCKKPWSHTFKDNRLNTDGIGRLHSWIQTHLDLTVTLYITSLPTTLNWALTHSHLFHPMQTSQNTENLPVHDPPDPTLTLPSHNLGYTWNNFFFFFSFLSTQRNVQKIPQYTVCIDTISPLGNNLINKNVQISNWNAELKERYQTVVKNDDKEFFPQENIAQLTQKDGYFPNDMLMFFSFLLLNNQ